MLFLASSQLPASTFLPRLPSARFCFPCLSRLAPHRYYAGSDPCPALASRQVSPLTPLCLPDIPPPNTSCRPNVAFLITPAHPAGHLKTRLRSEPTSSPQHTAESSSYAYGLPVRLRLLPTPPRGDAVTFDYTWRDSTWHGLSPYRQSVLTDAHRGREELPLPALRTVRAVFPHTALQSAVSIMGCVSHRAWVFCGGAALRWR